MKAILWPYRYVSMGDNWCQQMQWVVRALQFHGVEVVRHYRFVCRGLEYLPEYNYRVDQDADIVLYNHADESEIIGDVLHPRANWFFKPTVPTAFHTTLDTMGFGPYSSVGYSQPSLEGIDPKLFFDTKVAQWIQSRTCKWGDTLNKEVSIPESGYYLVVGQCGGDSVATRMDFGDYFTKLRQIVAELVRVGDRPIVVKLHPYTNGEPGKEQVGFADRIQQQLEAISPRVRVYQGKVSIHNFIQRAHCVLLANSGAGIEVMMHHKPLIAWGKPEYHWVTYDLRHLCDMRRALKLDWFDASKQDKFLCWYLERYCFYDQLTCFERVRTLLITMGMKNRSGNQVATAPVGVLQDEGT